jgi:ubiquinone/menaquinone biosynthesis C-methylase UbiE
MLVRSSLVAIGVVLLASSATLAQAPSAAFLDSLKRVEQMEKGPNDRQPAAKVMDAVGVKPGMVVGEVGAGRGRYTMHLARRVGTTGKIYANDIDQAGLAFLRDRCVIEKLANVETVLGSVEETRLPKGSLDMAFMVWVYHMLDSPVPVLKSLGPSLKPGATVVILDPVPEEVEEEFKGAPATAKFTVPTREHVERDARLAGFELVTSMIGFLEKDNIFILRKKG